MGQNSFLETKNVPHNYTKFVSRNRKRGMFQTK